MKLVLIFIIIEYYLVTNKVLFIMKFKAK